MTNPSTGIRQPNHLALPRGTRNGIRDIAPDRPQQNANRNGLQLRNRPGKRRLASYTSRPPSFRLQPVHRIRAKIDQIAPRRLKRSEKSFIIDQSVRGLKRLAHRPIKPRITRIKEPPGGRRRFTDEQQPNPGRAKALPQCLPGNVVFSHVSQNDPDGY
jgi:hypothetical protein